MWSPASYERIDAFAAVLLAPSDEDAPLEDHEEFVADVALRDEGIARLEPAFRGDGGHPLQILGRETLEERDDPESQHGLERALRGRDVGHIVSVGADPSGQTPDPRVRIIAKRADDRVVEGRRRASARTRRVSRSRAPSRRSPTESRASMACARTSGSAGPEAAPDDAPALPERRARPSPRARGRGIAACAPRGRPSGTPARTSAAPVRPRAPCALPGPPGARPTWTSAQVDDLGSDGVSVPLEGRDRRHLGLDGRPVEERDHARGDGIAGHERDRRRAPDDRCRVGEAGDAGCPSRHRPGRRRGPPSPPRGPRVGIGKRRRPLPRGARSRRKRASGPQPRHRGRAHRRRRAGRAPARLDRRRRRHRAAGCADPPSARSDRTAVTAAPRTRGSGSPSAPTSAPAARPVAGDRASIAAAIARTPASGSARVAMMAPRTSGVSTRSPRPRPPSRTCSPAPARSVAQQGIARSGAGSRRPPSCTRARSRARARTPARARGNGRR